jgi:hypothetical protein
MKKLCTDQRTNNGILPTSGAIKGERRLPISTPKKLPKHIRDERSSPFVNSIHPMAMELANERCFSENHMKQNLVGMNRMNVADKAQKNCPKMHGVFYRRKQCLVEFYQSSVLRILRLHQIQAEH